MRDEITKPDIVYVACGSDGLWRSLDLGASFDKVPGIGDARSVALTTDDQDLVLVAAGTASTCRTTAARPSARHSPAVASAVAFDPRNRRLAYAASGRALLRSVDGGRPGLRLKQRGQTPFFQLPRAATPARASAASWRGRRTRAA